MAGWEKIWMGYRKREGEGKKIIPSMGGVCLLVFSFGLAP
jgi:hypothetical protein